MIKKIRKSSVGNSGEYAKFEENAKFAKMQ